MTTRYKTKAFVFKKNDVNESDRVFSVFTDSFGRFDVLGKAIRKSDSKLRSGIDSFFMSDIEFIQGKNKKTLTDAIIIDKFPDIAKDLEKFKIAYKIGEILDNFIYGEERDEEIFNLINETFIKLNCLNHQKEKYFLVYYYFLWNIISILGYHPEVVECNVCQSKLTPDNIYFSNKLGGIICKKCLDHDITSVKMHSDAVKIIRIILRKEWQIISKLKIDTLSQDLFKKISDNYYFYLLSSHSFKNSYTVI